MKKIVFSGICLVLLFPVFVHSLFAVNDAQGKTDKKNTTETKPTTPEIKIVKNPTFNAGLINQTIKDFTDKIKTDNKGDTRLLSTEFMIFSSKMGNYYKYPDVELETLVYRVWYKKLSDAALGMCGARRYETAALTMNQKEKAEKYKEDYKKYFNDFKNLIVNKKKFEIPDDKLREMQKKKEKAEEEAAKKKRRR